MEDRDIINLFWERNELALQMIDRKYHSFCFRIAWNILTNREDSEECVNDTWFAAWNCIPPKKPTFLSAFIGKIIRGYAIDILRRKYAGKRMDMHIVHITDEVYELNTFIENNIEEHMKREELLSILNSFLENLNLKDRDIFVQRYWFAIPLKEISIRHHISVGAIKQNLLRSRNKLKCMLEEENLL